MPIKNDCSIGNVSTLYIDKEILITRIMSIKIGKYDVQHNNYYVVISAVVSVLSVKLVHLFETC